MTARTTIARLQVASNLADFINSRVLPGTGVDPDKFWAGFDAIVHDLAPKNAALLAERDRLQAAMDAWHTKHPGPVRNMARYQAHLQKIGYLVPVPADVKVKTKNVDAELALQALPLGALVGAVAAPPGQRDPALVLRQLLTRIHGVADIDDSPALQGRHLCQTLRTAAGVQVAGVLLRTPCDLTQVLALLPADVEADLLLAQAPAADAFDNAARLQRQRWTALWDEAGTLRARTWVHAGDGMVEQPMLRDLHPASPVAQEIGRFASFRLERLAAPPGLVLLRAIAPGEDRLIALAEVERAEADDAAAR
jgi:hypothetical protein